MHHTSTLGCANKGTSPKQQRKPADAGLNVLQYLNVTLFPFIFLFIKNTVSEDRNCEYQVDLLCSENYVDKLCHSPFLARVLCIALQTISELSCALFCQSSFSDLGDDCTYRQHLTNAIKIFIECPYYCCIRSSLILCIFNRKEPGAFFFFQPVINSVLFSVR